MPPVSQYFHPEAALAVRSAIAEAGGNEVFFVGRPGPEHAVGEVEVLARGHDSAVPAILRRARPGEVVIHNHPSGELVPSEADLGIASRGGEMGIAFFIVDNPARNVYAVVEPMPPPVTRPIAARTIERLLGPGGAIEKKLFGYEHRAQQIAMSLEVAAAFNQERVLMVEAGTGTGKSLAYLLPAILFARENRERVVVSTNTINLQEQLVGKDLPFLRDQLGLEFTSVLLKGRSNYLCRRKAEFAHGEQDRLFTEPGRQQLKSILAWAEKSDDGSRSDLPFVVPEDVWDEVASDGDDCLKVKSPYYSSCFFWQSRRAAAAADVIVVNHHLLMADLALRAATRDYTGTAVLPPYERVILDEAHNLEDVAASYFGTQTTGPGLLKALGRLLLEKDPTRGVLATLAQKLDGEEGLDELIAEAIHERGELGERVREDFQALARHTLGYLGVDDPGGEGLKLRLTPEVLRHPSFFEGIAPACVTLTRSLGGYASRLAVLGERVRGLGREDPVLISALSRIDAVRGRLNGAAAALAAFPGAIDDAAPCRWIEVKKHRATGEPLARLQSAPLEVADLLAANLHGRMKTVVMTSATLTVARRFEHFADRLGVSRLGRERRGTALFDSPFDFRRQALLLVAADMPEPQEPSFAEAARECIFPALEASRGRAFVLFTSYRLLDRTFRALEGRIRDAGCSPLKQGSAPRDQLLQRFRREAGSVLFAVDSFWEGVDVPGDALSLVILVRLPFKVPTEPLQEARVEAIERRGGDPFREYSVPQAVIKFRQGFGRLIRTRSDRGAVLVLDPRVTTKRYGRLFLDSLPEVRTVIGTRAEVVGELGRFFAPA